MRGEKTIQDSYPWARSTEFPTYNEALGLYQVRACLDYARGHRALDLACGDGTLTAQLAPRFKSIVGVDVSSEHLAKARARVPGAIFHESRIEDMALDERFDSIFMLNVLEHVVDPDVALRAAARHLAPGGALMVHVPNAAAINRRIAVAMGTLVSCDELSPYDIQVAGHRRSYIMASLVADIKHAGLRVVATGGVFYKMLSTPQMDWLLSQGPWKEGGFGWGRVGAVARDWRAAKAWLYREVSAE